MSLQACASRRIDELLKQFDARVDNAKKQSDGSDTLISQRDAAEDAGLSKRQQVSAVRIANIPAERFERAIEAPTPPTKTALAEMGRKPRETRPLVDLEGRNDSRPKTKPL